MLLERFTSQVRKQALFTGDDFLLLAVSGGLDSVVMTALCKEAGYKFAIAHCNFQLRGEESARDQAFVRELADKYEVPFFLRCFETEKYATEKKLSIQEAARELRYGFFQELIQDAKYTPAYLLTAHHRDDNVETVLMNFLRGTGLQGMTGIPPVNGKIRRPLLLFSREELLDFAKDRQLRWVEDSSNQLSKYTRNFLRNEWIPAIEKIYPEVKTNIARNIERFSEINKQYRISLENGKKKLIHRKGNEWHIPVRLLLKTNKAMVYELLSEHGFSEGQMEEVYKLANAGSGKYIEAANSDKQIILHRKWFVIASRMDKVENGHYIIDMKNGELPFPGGKIKTYLLVGSVLSEDPLIASIDADTIEFPLLLRKPKTGDYFYPLGMKKKKKKVSRFFIDNKLSKTEKEKAWILESGGKIIWILGQRIDERVKLKSSSTHTLCISWTQTE